VGQSTLPPRGGGRRPHPRRPGHGDTYCARVARPAAVAAGHGRRCIDAAAAAGVRGVHPRLLVPAGADTVLADCGVPLRANRTLRNDEQR